jgi:predicted O-methyltransferase YrrM
MSAVLQTPITATKAGAGDFLGRFREIVSDPLNLLIERDPLAGYVQDGMVVLHNGIRVPFDGPDAYYGSFSYILNINRGVHEPLEEYVFQELLKVIPESPTMLELGAYWAHYSMWMKQRRPNARVHMVEPNEGNIQIGKNNFARNHFVGEFTQAFVGVGHFVVDDYLKTKNIDKLDVLHADIQSFEVEMLQGCEQALQAKAIDYVFVSTHTQELHAQVVQMLNAHSYRVEVSSDFEYETTSYDGFVFASGPHKAPVFNGFTPLSRLEISQATPRALLDSVNHIEHAKANKGTTLASVGIQQ